MFREFLEREDGNDPTCLRWQRNALPLCYTRIMTLFSILTRQSQDILEAIVNFMFDSK
jgi:hypothetical protein